MRSAELSLDRGPWMVISMLHINACHWKQIELESIAQTED